MRPYAPHVGEVAGGIVYAPVALAIAAMLPHIRRGLARRPAAGAPG